MFQRTRKHVHQYLKICLNKIHIAVPAFSKKFLLFDIHCNQKKANKTKKSFLKQKIDVYYSNCFYNKQFLHIMLIEIVSKKIIFIHIV